MSSLHGLKGVLRVWTQFICKNLISHICESVLHMKIRDSYFIYPSIHHKKKFSLVRLLSRTFLNGVLHKMTSRLIFFLWNQGRCMKMFLSSLFTATK